MKGLGYSGDFTAVGINIGKLVEIVGRGILVEIVGVVEE